MYICTWILEHTWSYNGFNKWCMFASKKCFCVHSFPTVLLIVYPTTLFRKCDSSSQEFRLWPHFHFDIGHICLHWNYCV